MASFWKNRTKKPHAARRLAGRARPASPRRPRLEPLEDRTVLSTFTVLNAADSGAGSLRDAIAKVNADKAAGVDVIHFNIASVAPTISLQSALPAITHPVFIDGTSQPAGPVTLDGIGAGAASDGLTIAGGDSTVQGLVVVRFGGNGIVLEGHGGDTLIGNLIGTDFSLDHFGNGASGIFIDGTAGNVIGGTTFGTRNVISANGRDGVFIFSAKGDALHNVVEGNYIGVDAFDFGPIGNGPAGPNGQGSGVVIQGAGANTIGGDQAAAANVISGNNGAGVFLFSGGGPAPTKNVVLGNFIGTDASGGQAFGNGVGVELDDASGNVIGGASPADRNVISANTGDGVLIRQAVGATAPSGNLVEGNYIGTNSAGTNDLGNGANGVELNNAAGNTVGGSAPFAGNLISGNAGDGVLIDDTLGVTSGNVVQGNFIGTDFTGTQLPLSPPSHPVQFGNLGAGVGIASASGNTVGGTVLGAGNVIAGNQAGGVFLSGASQNLIEGNMIGTDLTGRQPLGNAPYGVGIVGGSGNTVGGTAAGAGNVISGNVVGVSIDGGNANFVEGNDIGTDVSGARALANTGGGVALFDGASQNQIGGTTASARNVISGNRGDGVSLSSASAADLHNRVEGNYIGTDVTGFNALANTGNGVNVQGGADDNVIGGTAAGAGNLISGNQADGVRIGFGASGDVVQGNTIGTDVKGTFAVGNVQIGVELSGCSGDVVGGTQSGAGNLVSGNQFGGVVIDTDFFTGDLASANLVEGNMIGTDVRGSTLLGNGGFGGLAVFGSSDNQIGGTAKGAGNLVADSFAIEEDFFGNPASGNTVQGNLIGTDVTGTLALGGGLTLFTASTNVIGGAAKGAGNLIISMGLEFGSSDNVIQGNKIGTDITGTKRLVVVNTTAGGLGISNGSNDNLVGGTASGEGNLISGGSGDGIDVSVSSGNVIEGNKIGTDVTGKIALGNASNGVEIDGGSNNVVGGAAAGAGNLISGNANFGVFLFFDSGPPTGTVIEGNKIGTDVTGTVALGNAAQGVFGEDDSGTVIGGTAPGAGNVISGNGLNGILLFASTNDVIEGNRIGTNAAGTSALGNGGDGVHILNTFANTVGGTAAGAGNQISGNGGDGVFISQTYNQFYQGPSPIVVQGNLIGTDVTGKKALGNHGDGVEIAAGPGNTVGGSATGAGNIIAFNGGDGVLINAGTGNLVSGNSIFSNGGLGIELIAANNANNLQAAPALTAATSANGVTTIQGTLTSTPNTTFTLEFFSNATADPSGFGEGQTFLGSITVTTDATGVADFTAAFAFAVPKGQFITATATDPLNDTSEFSNDVLVTA
jgi:hypothetical protein